MNTRGWTTGVAVLACTVCVLFAVKGLIFKGHKPETEVPPLPSVAGKPIQPHTAATPVASASTPRPPSGEMSGGMEGGRPGVMASERLAEAEAEYALNQLYEAEARETLPNLSIQTHNPVWALQYESRQGLQPQSPEGKPPADEWAESGVQPLPGPLPAPQSGPFGNIQPSRNEVWLRIPPEKAREYKDIMAQHADLYRLTTGKPDPVIVTLWVGGRPYARQQYE